MDSGVGFAFSRVKQVPSFCPWWHQVLWPALKERLGHGSRGAERMSGGRQPGKEMLNLESSSSCTLILYFV